METRNKVNQQKKKVVNKNNINKHTRRYGDSRWRDEDKTSNVSHGWRRRLRTHKFSRCRLVGQWLTDSLTDSLCHSLSFKRLRKVVFFSVKAQYHMSSMCSRCALDVRDIYCHGTNAFYSFSFSVKLNTAHILYSLMIPARPQSSGPCFHLFFMRNCRSIPLVNSPTRST